MTSCDDDDVLDLRMNDEWFPVFTSLNSEAGRLHPESYRVNSPNETRLLAIADNFQRQYSHLYPERRPLLLCPANECGVKVTIQLSLLHMLLHLQNVEECMCTCFCLTPVFISRILRSLCQPLFGPHHQSTLNFTPGRAVPPSWRTSCLWSLWSRLWTRSERQHYLIHLLQELLEWHFNIPHPQIVFSLESSKTSAQWLMAV